MKKLTSLVLCTLILASSMVGMAGCKVADDVAKSEIKYYEEGIEWWDDLEYTYTSDRIDCSVGLSMEDVIYSDETSAVVYGHCYKNDRTVKEWLYKASYDGHVSREVDLMSLGWDEDSYYDFKYYEYEGNCYCLVSHYNDEIYNNELVICSIDWESGTITEQEIFDNREILGYEINKVFARDDSLCYIANNNGEMYLYEVNGDDTSLSEFSFGPDVSYIYPETISVQGDDIVMKLGLVEHTYDMRYIFVKYNISTDEYTEYELDSFNYHAVSGNLYQISEDAINIINIDDGSSEEVLRFENTYVNCNVTGSNMNYKLLFADDDKVVLGYQTSYTIGNDGPFSFITLTRAETNPNEGKIVLTVANNSTLYFDAWKQLNALNKNNSEFFYRFADEYDYSNVLHNTFPDGFDSNDLITTKDNVASQIMTDIESGNGPDIVIIDSYQGQIDNGRYLIEVNEGQYSVPFGYMLSAMVINNDYLTNSSANGITYDDYFTIRDSVGSLDIIGDKLHTIETLIRYSSNQFFDEEGHITIDNEEFRSMAEFVNQLPEQWVNPHDNPLSDFAWYNDYGDLFQSYMEYYARFYENYSILGIPSLSGESLTATGFSVGITNCCPVVDGAREFVDFMLSYDFQLSLCNTMQPVNNEAFIDYARLQLASADNGLGPNAYMTGVDGIPESIIDYYLDAMSGVEIQRGMDSGVLRIIYEEIQVYFAGDKTLDEVIPIIEDRVNNMIEERG